MKRPSVLVVSRRTVRKHKYIDYVGEYHLALLIRMGILPVMVPVVEGAFSCLPEYMAEMKGLLLVEGEDIEPKRYKALPENFEYLEKTHALKDKIEIKLIRQALRKKLPILGICRGSQLLNVVCGGTLYGDVQKEKKSSVQHINHEHYDAYRHPISFVEASPLENWYQRKSMQVNSYHHQGIRDLGAPVQAHCLRRGRARGGLLRSEGQVRRRPAISSRTNAGRSRWKFAHLEGLQRGSAERRKFAIAFSANLKVGRNQRHSVRGFSGRGK